MENKRFLSNKSFSNSIIVKEESYNECFQINKEMIKSKSTSNYESNTNNFDICYINNINKNKSFANLNYNTFERLQESIETKGNYIVGKTLGEGAFGHVKLGLHTLTNEKVAIKILDKTRMKEEEDDYHRVKKEIDILKKMKHRHIIQLYEIIESKDKIYLVLEYCEGKELFDYIVDNQKLIEYEACRIFQQLINGVEYLHVQNVVHRDLKPENILLDMDLNIRISDFGLSTHYLNDQLLQTPCGTPSYAPPEMLKGEEYHGLLTDIWSCGIILYAMLCGYLPFSESNEEINCRNIVSGVFEMPDHLSLAAIDLIQNILKVEPLERYDIQQIKNHPWFKQVKPSPLPGIVVDVHKIPIDNKIVDYVIDHYYNGCSIELKEKFIENLRNNKFDQFTAIYYLIVNKQSRELQPSISDLTSSEFIEYISSDNCYKDIYEEEKKEEKNGKDLHESNKNLIIVTTDEDIPQIEKDYRKSISEILPKQDNKQDYKLIIQDNNNNDYISNNEIKEINGKNKKVFKKTIKTVKRRSSKKKTNYIEEEIYRLDSVDKSRINKNKKNYIKSRKNSDDRCSIELKSNHDIVIKNDIMNKKKYIEKTEEKLKKNSLNNSLISFSDIKCSSNLVKSNKKVHLKVYSPCEKNVMTISTNTQFVNRTLGNNLFKMKGLQHNTSIKALSDFTIIDIDCLIMNSVDAIMCYLVEVLKIKKVSYVKVNQFKYKCSKSGICFNLEICKLSKLTSIHYIKAKCYSGSYDNYRQLLRFILDYIKK